MAKQLLHLVMGGRVTDPQSIEFQDLNEIDIVGIFPNYAAAEEAWRGKAQLTVDGTLSIRPARWDRKAFALELTEARSAMPMSEPVMEDLRREARY